MCAAKQESEPKRHEQYLLELTNLPTAPGCEGAVSDWIDQWVGQRAQLRIRRDRFKNLMITCKNRRRGSRQKPIIFTAHMDHPGFVVTGAEGNLVEAEFRGGVGAEYFKNALVRWRRSTNCLVNQDVSGVVKSIKKPNKKAGNKYIKAFIELKGASAVPKIGDIITWDLPPSKIVNGLLNAPVCDDLAALAGALAALEQVSKKNNCADVRVLLTRAEEVGFIGAMGACQSRLIPKTARLIALENSRSFTDSPIGGGPIIRVGDATSTFDPQLLSGVCQLARSLSKKKTKKSKNTFTYQRKLMVGGSCEATAYQAFGYQTICLCLALGNYHNQKSDPAVPNSLEQKTQPIGIDREIISVNDYHNLVLLLTEIAEKLDDLKLTTSLRHKLDELYESRKAILD